MAKGKLNFLDRTEIERIHAISISILEEIGITVHSDSVSELLVEHGCIKSEDGKRLLIPESVVKSAISDAPKSILLVARGEGQDMRIPSDDTIFMANGGTGIFIKDMVTGESRDSTKEDLRKFTILVDEMPQVDFCWNMVGALDQPDEIKGLVEFKTSLENTTKHIQGESMNAEEARHMVELGAVLTDGFEELANRPIFSSVQCPISPLSFEKGLAEAQVELSRAGIPIVAMSASLAGLTSPITLSGTIAQVNAENLASLVISQASSRGAPWIYSSDASPANLTSGSIDYGAFESPLLRAGCGQMSRYYGFPTMVSGASVEELSLSLRSAREGVIHMLIEALIPSDLGSGFGGIDQAAGASMEQLIVDAWIWSLAGEFARTFDTDELAISFETIREAAEDGTYLNKSHTMSRYRKEFAAVTHPELGLEGREDLGSPGKLIRDARDEVKRILARPRSSVVTSEQSREMAGIIDRSR